MYRKHMLDVNNEKQASDKYTACYLNPDKIMNLYDIELFK